jgi:hypothetical protein
MYIKDEDKLKFELLFFNTQDVINKRWNKKRGHWALVSLLAFFIGIIVGCFTKF